MQDFALIFGVATFLGGMIGFCAVKFRWDWLSPRIRLGWVKTSTKMVQLATVLIGIGTALSATADKSTWTLPAIANAVSYFVWQLLEWWVESRLKEQDKAANEQVEELRAQLTSLTASSETIRQSLNMATQAIRNQGRSRSRPLDVLRSVYSGPDQIGVILQSITRMLRWRLTIEARSAGSFQIVLFVEQDDVMTPMPGCAYDSSDRLYETFPRFEQNRELFRLHSPTPQTQAMAVRCIIDERMILVPSCQDAPAAEFCYLDDNQSQRRRSILAYHLGPVEVTRRTRSQASIVVTTDIEGYFQERDRLILDEVLQSSAAHLRLILAIRALVTREP